MNEIGDEGPECRPKFTPTPAEIAAACAEIQAGWSADEERKRRAWSISREIEVARPHRVATE